MRQGSAAEFEIQWSTGNVTWVPYNDIKHLQALHEYYEALGVSHIREVRSWDNPPGATSSPDSGEADSRTDLIEGPIHLGAVLVFLRDLLTDSYSQHEHDQLYRGYTRMDIRMREEPSTTANNTSSLAFHTLPTPAFAISTVPNHYNIDDHAHWERYAEVFQMWLAQHGPHLGNPPPGYCEVFKIRQRYAPCPEDYLVPQPNAERAAPVPAVPIGIPGVTMSEGMFSTLLMHNAALQSQLGALTTAHAHAFQYFGPGSRG